MIRINTCAASIALALSGTALAAPTAPSIDMYGSNNLQFSKIELAMETTSGYNQMVKYHDKAKVDVKFNQWSGTSGNTYNIYFDGVKVATGPITGSQTTASFEYGQGGLFDMEIEACDETGCSKSAPAKITIADTDGSHLAPLAMNVDPNNKSYNTDPNTVVGTYFVEWGIYGRDYTVDNLPADNLTHILYGFIPICGPNESVKSVGGNSYNALMTACQGVDDYEVVIHDPWAAFQKSFPQAGHEYSSPIKGNYAMMMALKQRNPDLKIIPSIGGWTLSDPFFDFTTKANRDTFIASVKKFLNTWKFYDGVDIDWEFPGGGGAAPDLGDPVNDGPAYIALMAELRVMLDELEAENGRTYELTSAIGVGHDKIEDVDYGDAIQYMDYIFAMTYDFYGGWNNVLGHQTALNCGNFMRPGQCDGTGLDENGEPYTGPAYTTDNGIQLLLEQGVPANKLVVGTAMYGRGWEGVLPSSLSDPSDPMTGVGNGKLKGSSAQGVWEDGVIDYKGIKANMLGANNQGINGFEYGYDEMAEAPYVWNRTSGQLITFDDDRSVKAKGAYVRSLGLAGLFSWEIDADNGDILNAMHEGLAGGTTDPVNRKPTAAAGADQSVEGPASVSLDGSASKDSDGIIASYAWSQVSGPAVTLANANAAVASFDVVEVTQQETLTFSLTVTDNEGATSTDTVVVTVNPKDTGPVNTAPVAVVTAPTEVNAGDVVVVDASASSDADQDTLTFTWDVPAGINATVQGASVSFVAAEYTQDTVLNFSVTVSDGTDTSVAATSVKVLKKTTGGGTCTNAWDSSAVYTGGDQVTQGGKVWEAKWWTTGEDPTTTGQWGVWKEIGPASCAN
ncbi:MULTISPECIES: glycosyl hydrolase family 18 protein [unclassified Vibrio]|uniref:glycosyl hydrolase family 18 protein n=1 Tax=unclassified Vibrio TaxID=2614977 RepID=UPI00159D7FB6|nr:MULTISPECIES: glycosyl hydrolase family 18 protein [unclassified Vibrio]NVN79970.1 chitinase [Vibrio sp. Scap16]QLE94639.1 chitinase [Vibrio sp. Scap24]